MSRRPGSIARSLASGRQALDVSFVVFHSFLTNITAPGDFSYPLPARIRATMFPTRGGTCLQSTWTSAHLLQRLDGGRKVQLWTSCSRLTALPWLARRTANAAFAERSYAIYCRAAIKAGSIP